METKYAGSEWPTDAKLPSQMPKNAEHIATVSWSWGPAHCREDHYHLSMDDDNSHWVLWIGCFDVDDTQAWEHSPYAYGPKTDISVKEAVRELLQQGWSGEAEQDKDLDQFHQVCSEGILCSADLGEIAKNVWG